MGNIMGFGIQNNWNTMNNYFSDLISPAAASSLGREAAEQVRHGMTESSRTIANAVEAIAAQRSAATLGDAAKVSSETLSNGIVESPASISSATITATANIGQAAITGAALVSGIGLVGEGIRGVTTYAFTYRQARAIEPVVAIVASIYHRGGASLRLLLLVVAASFALIGYAAYVDNSYWMAYDLKLHILLHFNTKYATVAGVFFGALLLLTVIEQVFVGLSVSLRVNGVVKAVAFNYDSVFAFMLGAAVAGGIYYARLLPEV